MTTTFITSSEDFDVLQNKTSKFAHLDRHSFEFPLKLPVINDVYLEMSVFSTREFGDFLKNVSMLHGENELYFVSLTPERKYYLSSECPTYGAFRLNNDWDGKDYRYGLISTNDNEPHPGFGYYVMSFIIFGDSGKWFIYGDRDWDFILGSLVNSSDHSPAWPINNELAWLTKEEIAVVIMGQADPRPLYQERGRKVLAHLGLEQPPSE